MELFHGPTLAFKDFALQFLGHLLDHILAKRGQKVVVMGATSGDLLNEHPEIRTSLPTEIKFLANPGGLLDFTFSRHKNIDEPQNKVSILNYRTYRKRKRLETI